MRHDTPRNYREAVAAEVRAMMGRTRTSQTTLARELGLAQSSLSRRLVGDVAFDLDDMARLAAYFDVPVVALLPKPEEVTAGTRSHLPRWQSAWTTAGERAIPDIAASRPHRTTVTVAPAARAA